MLKNLLIFIILYQSPAVPHIQMMKQREIF